MTPMTAALETSPRAPTHDRAGNSYADSPENPVLLGVRAASLVLGFVSQVPLGLLHPHEKQPNGSVGALGEYAHDDDRVLVHLGQFARALLLVIVLVLVLVLAVLTAQTGFSPEAKSIAFSASALLAVFVIGTCVALWRRATRHNENAA